MFDKEQLSRKPPKMKKIQLLSQTTSQSLTFGIPFVTSILENVLDYEHL